MPQSDVHSIDDKEDASMIPAENGNILSLEIDHEIFSTVILSLLLIQEGQLSVSGERISCWLTAERTKPAQKKCGKVI